MSNNKDSARYSEKPYRGRPEPSHDWAARLEKQLKWDWQRGYTKVDINKQY